MYTAGWFDRDFLNMSNLRGRTTNVLLYLDVMSALNVVWEITTKYDNVHSIPQIWIFKVF